MTNRYQSCKQIMPKFLWEHIIKALSADHLFKMHIVDKKFFIVANSGDLQQLFIDNIKAKVIVIEGKSNRIKNFWLIAWYSHTFDDIPDALRYIEKKNNTKPAYYKILLMNGEHAFRIKNNGTYTYSNSNINIELSGIHKHAKSTIIEGDTLCYKHINITGCFFIKYVIFNHNSICVGTPKDKFSPASKVYVSNCGFNNKSLLEINSIANVNITHCIFDNSSMIFGNNTYGYFIGGGFVVTENILKVNYIVAHNTFVNNKYIACFSFAGAYHKSSIINIVDNIISDSELLSIVYSSNATIRFRDNMIKKVVTCIRSHNDSAIIIFEDNIFDKVESLHKYHEIDKVLFEGYNEYSDCGENFMRFIME